MAATKRPPRPGEGRPRKYKTVQQLQDAIDKYFEETPFAEWTITGLALALGSNRQFLIDYEERPEFSDIVKRAKAKVAYSYEVDLKKDGRAGTIFALKNFGWRDKQEQDVKLSGGLDIKTIKLEVVDPKD